MNATETPLQPDRTPTLILDADERPMELRTPARGPRVGLPWLVLGAVIVTAAALVWVWRTNTPPPVPVAPAATQPPAASALPAPSVRFPIEEVPAHAGLTTGIAPTPGLPLLAASDAALIEALTGLPGGGMLVRLLEPQDVARRIVATIDNLPRSSLPAQIRSVRTVAGAFAVSGSDAPVTIASDNAARYASYLQVAEAIDTRQLVAAYVRFYPLLQQAYRELGYPNAHFNDRLVEAIDLLLATPAPAEPVALVQPNVMYQFANPALEALPVGQKMMLRMGNANAARAKAKLKELRRALTGVASPI
jgi:hypothetical protein